MSFYFRERPLIIEGQFSFENQSVLGDDFVHLLAEAYTLVGRFDGIFRSVDNTDWYEKLLIAQEVCASCALESVSVPFYDLLTQKPLSNNAVLATNLLDAMQFIKTNTFSEGSIRNIHQLLRRPITSKSEFRNDQRIFHNGIFFLRGSHPIPPSWISGAIKDMEKYIKAVEAKNALTSAARIQYQFEVLTPFDHHTRMIARLIVMQVLQWSGLLAHPILGISEYLLSSNIDYKDRIAATYQHGEDMLYFYWIRFFLTAIVASAKKAIHLIESLADKRKEHIAILPQICKGNKSTQAIYEYVADTILVNVRQISDALGLSFSNVTKIIKAFEEAGIVRQVTQKERYRQFGYAPVLDLVEYV